MKSNFLDLAKSSSKLGNNEMPLLISLPYLVVSCEIKTNSLTPFLYKISASSRSASYGLLTCPFLIKGIAQ